MLALAFGLSAPALAIKPLLPKFRQKRLPPPIFRRPCKGLAANDFNTKQAAVEALAASGHAHTLDILPATLADDPACLLRAMRFTFKTCKPTLLHR